MKVASQPTVLRSAKIALAAGVVILGVTVAVRQLRPPTTLVAGAPLEDLRRQAEALRAYDDSAAARAAERMSELRAQLWTATKLDEWKRSLSPRWTLQEAQPQPHASTITRRFVLTRRGAAARDWPEIHAFLRELDGLPTAVLHEVKLAVTQPQSREFQDVEIILDLAFRPEAATAGGKTTSAP